MNYMQNPRVKILLFVVVTFAGVSTALGQGSTALERGYRTGYSDGYNAGFRDAADKAPKNYQNKEEYQRADRSFNQVWGPIEDYRDGYQQGFESGYTSGFDNQQFDSTIPTGLRRRSQDGSQPVNPSPNPQPVDQQSSQPASQPSDTSNTGRSGSISIPRNTILTLELLTPLSTDATQAGDRFQAKVVDPSEFGGAIVEGRVSQVRKPGKVKGVAGIQLTFERIHSSDGRTADFHAELLEVLSMGGIDAPTVDTEGGVRGRDSTKDDVTKVGAASGIGAIIGAIAGGGKGAAIGAVIGGGAGTAGVMTQKGKDIRLEQGQQMKVRTSADAATL